MTRCLPLFLPLTLAIAIALPAVAQPDVTLTIHYHREDGVYDGWGIHLWNAVESSPGGLFIVNGSQYDWSTPLPPTETDDFGASWAVPIAYPDRELGFIIHNGDNQDPGPDMSWGDYDAHPEIWILSGITQIFTAEPNPDVRLVSAESNGANTITLTLSQDASQLDAFHVFKDGVEEGVAGRNSPFPRTVLLNLNARIDVTSAYAVSDDVGGNTVDVLHIFDENTYVYEGDDLGAAYSPVSTTFKLWSPVATAAKVHIYDNPYPVSGEPDDVATLTRPDQTGLMSVTVPGDQRNRYYLYEMTVYGQTYLTPDPYSIALSSNSQRSMIIDLADTDPPGWASDTYAPIAPADAIIYELHVRDMTCAPSWNGTEANRNRFLGVVEHGTSYDGVETGFDHLRSLGVNTVQIMPIFDFASVDENDPQSRNWGYDPYAYNVPEGSYSSDPDDGRVRIREMKAMIQGFHAAGFKVIMDVVYNHTSATGYAGSLFDAMVPRYYYRLNDDGSYSNGSGVGNEIATEKPMVRNFILQSCRYWAQEYHIDGFRFDLMGLIDTPLMTEITQEIRAINPYALIYGEPWGGFGTTPLTGKGDQRGLGFGCFNDNIRNAIRGSTDGIDGGFAMGVTSLRQDVLRGIDGAINDFTDGPTETINAISAHDNYTWWDKLDHRWNPNSTPPPHLAPGVLTQIDEFGESMVLLSQGIPFLHAGSEFLRTKRTGDPDQTEESIRNSDNAGDDVNMLDWQRLSEHLDVNEYTKGLIALRKARPELRLASKEEILAHQHVLTAGIPAGVVAYRLDDITPQDTWGDLVVIHNPNASPSSVLVPAGHWMVVVDDDEAGTTPVATGPAYVVSPASLPSHLDVPGYATTVLAEMAEPDLQLAIFQNPTLDRYLHLAVNAAAAVGTVSLTIDDEPVELTDQGGGSWFGSYVLSGSGDLTAVLTTEFNVVTRRFVVGALGDEPTSVAAADGAARLDLPGGAVTGGGYLAVFDASGRPDLPAGTYAFGPAGVSLQSPALVRLRGDSKSLVVQRLDGGTWVTLPSCSDDGWVLAATDHLGAFRLASGTQVPSTTRLAGNYPNPFNPSTVIRFDLGVADAAHPVTLQVFDIGGRLVRTLETGVLAPGPQEQEWDGRDATGQQAASGVYLYRLETPDRAYVGRMLMLK